MINKTYADFSWEQAAQLLAVDSPSCFTANAGLWVKNAFEALGYSPVITNKGGILVDLGGEDVNDGLVLSAHADTLGAMVCEVKSNGRLKARTYGSTPAAVLSLKAPCSCAMLLSM